MGASGIGGPRRAKDMTSTGTLSRRRMLKTGCASLGASALTLGPALAAKPVLTLSNPRLFGPTTSLTFDRSALEDMPHRVLSTRNDFVEGVATFRGPLAYDVIDLIGRAGSHRVRMSALNGYYVEIDIDEIRKYQPILALEMNGSRLTRRDKGPIWLMYPMDDHDELQDPSYNSRLIWQMFMIELL
jgi:hypothetical protein